MITRSLCFAALAACSTSHSAGPDAVGPDAPSDAAADPGPAARAAFHAAFVGQQYTSLPGVLVELESANTASPHDPDTMLTIGLANLWGIAEIDRDPSQAPAIPARAMRLISALTEAQQLRPTDARVPGFLGANLIGIGRETNNPALVTQGQSVLASAVAAYPEFNLFIDALINQDAPVGSPELATAVEDYFHTLDLCFGVTISRTNPDATPYLGLATTSGTKRVCWDDDKSAHNFEGFFLNMGDTLIKAGQNDAARVAYADAKLLPSYATWPYRPMLEDRLATFDARAALYADSDPLNDPKLVGDTKDQCGSCHAQ